MQPYNDLSWLIVSRWQFGGNFRLSSSKMAGVPARPPVAADIAK